MPNAEGSLAGRVIVETRPEGLEAEDEELALPNSLVDRGAKVFSTPAIRLIAAPRRPLDRAARDLVAGGYDWAIFTSRTGVEAIYFALARVAAAFPDVRARIASVGEPTMEALRMFGAEPDLVPPTFTTAALGRVMPRGRGRVLLARADIAPDALESAVASKGWTTVRVDAYRTRLVKRLRGGAAAALRTNRVDAVTFTSASTVEGFLLMTRALRERGVAMPPAVCIGPVTAAAARDAGLRVAAVARPHTIEGLVAALERALGPRPSTKKER